jgi:hypothetical protein
MMDLQSLESLMVLLEIGLQQHFSVHLGLSPGSQSPMDLLKAANSPQKRHIFVPEKLQPEVAFGFQPPFFFV